MESVKISRSKAIQMLVDNKKLNDFTREELLEILRDTEQAYYENSANHQLGLELALILNKRVEVVWD